LRTRSGITSARLQKRTKCKDFSLILLNWKGLPIIQTLRRKEKLVLSIISSINKINNQNLSKFMSKN
jgi:hypothetical protein